MMRTGFQRLMQAILDCEKPVIVALNGTAAGGGAMLVLAADLVIAADTAKIIQVFVRRGLDPRRRRRVPAARASSACTRRRSSSSSATTSPAADAERSASSTRSCPRAELHADGQGVGRAARERPDQGDRLVEAAAARRVDVDRARRSSRRRRCSSS